jgi:hypothetical protein
MTRYVHTPLTSGFSSQSAIEQNFEDIEASLANTLSRTLESPNMMQAVLDMNSNRIINLPTPTSATEPVTYGMFVSSSVAPVYAGTVKESFTATAGQAVFTLITAYVPGANNLNVFINGLKQSSTAYTETNSTTVTFASGL